MIALGKMQLSLRQPQIDSEIQLELVKNDVAIIASWVVTAIKSTFYCFPDCGSCLRLSRASTDYNSYDTETAERDRIIIKPLTLTADISFPSSFDPRSPLRCLCRTGSTAVKST